MRIGKPLSLLMALALLSACELLLPPKRPQPQAVVTQPGAPAVRAPVDASANNAALARHLVALGDAALASDRLMTPPGDNAFEYYRQALRLDASIQGAHEGMQFVTRRYLELAEAALRAGDGARGNVLLDRALMIAATPEQVAALRKKYPQRERVVAANEFVIPVGPLAAREPAVVSQLGEIAGKAQAADSRLLIVARNDDEGRWIYQQMREAVMGYRLRGNIEIGNPPRVVLIDL